MESPARWPDAGARARHNILMRWRGRRTWEGCVPPRSMGSRGAMTTFGYTMMCEQAPPDQLVRDLQKAEAAGFEFSVVSDPYQPWLEEQGHSGYASSILAPAAQATSTTGLMPYRTSPTLPHPTATPATQ